MTAQAKALPPGPRPDPALDARPMVPLGPRPDPASDSRFTWGLILDVFALLERHGYRRGDGQHTGQAIGLLAGLAGVFEGTGEAS